MTPNELYALPPVEVSSDPYRLRHHIDEVDPSCIEVNTCDIECRYYANHSDDGERTWTLFSAWYSGNPFMICQSAGRGGRDHTYRFVTNAETYRAAVEHLKDLLKLTEDDEISGLVSADQELENLDAFWNHRLSELYDPKLIPKLKAGDIVNASALLDHLRPNLGRVAQRIRIESVHPYRPRELYRGKRLDWRWGDYSKGEDPSSMVYDKDNGAVWTVFNDNDVLEVLEHAKEEWPDEK